MDALTPAPLDPNDDSGPDQDALLRRDADFFAARRTMTWRPRPISPGLRLLLWSLRLYVVLMLIVVVVELMRVVA
ncbi:hypothetical protein [Acidiphilium sp.]|uniref:hypothetical protein n=1 Tax=Acidiphilium sp. TaxID=527 RepID=UPI003CFEA1B0